MIESRTTFIIGAGASVDYGLPTGQSLKQDIENLLNIAYDDYGHGRESGDPLIKDALRVYARKQNMHIVDPLVQKAHAVRNAMPLTPSIDTYLDSQRGDALIELLGKLAITRAILKAEAGSHALYVDPRKSAADIQFRETEMTWLGRFWKFLAACPKRDLADRLSRITFVVFNYDRCVEQFLFHAIRRYHPDTSKAEAAEIMGALKVYHPYGSVGVLPWMKSGGDSHFGHEPTADHLLSLSQQIRTFSEGTDPARSDIQEIREAVRLCTTIICIGFAYHEPNLELLASSEGKSGVVEFFGTAMGLSPFTIEATKRTVANLGLCNGPNSIRLFDDKNGLQLLEYYSGGLKFQ